MESCGGFRIVYRRPGLVYQSPLREQQGRYPVCSREKREGDVSISDLTSQEISQKYIVLLLLLLRKLLLDTPSPGGCQCDRIAVSYTISGLKVPVLDDNFS